MRFHGAWNVGLICVWPQSVLRSKTRPRRWRGYLGPICCSSVDHAGGASAVGRSHEGIMTGPRTN